MNPLIPVAYIALLAFLLLPIVAALSWITARDVRIPLRLAMAASRVLAVAVVLALLLNPGQWREKVEGSVSGWALMLDRSASMSTEDAGSGGTRSRWDEALEIARQAWSVSDHPERVRGYAFADSAEGMSLEELAGLQPVGNQTRITAAGQEVLARERNRTATLRGIVLLSDGRQPIPAPAEPFALRAAARAAPIYPIALGGEVLAGDVEVRIPRRRYVSFLGQPVSVQALLVNTRMGPIEARVTLRDAAGGTLGEQTLFATNGQAVPFSFELKPDKPGYFEYAIETPLRAGESDRANNTVSLGVFVLTEKLNVLILEGEPYWDTKFLSHLLRGQTNMSVTAVFRVAKDRFFKVSTDTALAAVTEDTFPASDEAMSEYDLVVLGRGSEYLIDEARARLLDRFVRDHGGCLFFARGKSYQGATSPLSSLEPVEWGEDVAGPYSVKPLLAGEYAGLFGGLLPERDSSVWNSLPTLERGTRCESLKSFSSVLADGVPKGGDSRVFPALVSRRYGLGLVLLINGDGLWKWGFYPKVAEAHDVYKSLWIRLFQWAVSYAEFNPGSDYAIRTDRGTARAREPVRVLVSAKPHAALTSPVVRVYRGDQFLQEIPLAAHEEQKGQWIGLAMLDEPGIYRLSAETPGGAASGAQTTLQILPPPSEADALSADGEYLRELAAVSGGRMITREELPALIKTLEAPLTVEQRGYVEWDPAWDRAWLAVLLVLCFSCEWFWRRKQGLM